MKSMKKVMILFLLFAFLSIGVPMVNAEIVDVCANIEGDQVEVPSGYYEKEGNCFKRVGGGDPMNAPCFNELGAGSCGQKLAWGWIERVLKGTGGCPIWYPMNCVRIVQTPTPKYVSLRYGEVYNDYTCDMFNGCRVDTNI